MQIIPVIYLAALVFALVSAIQAPRVRYFDKFTWVLFILFIPFIGIVGWFFFGRDRSPEPLAVGYYESEPVTPDEDDDVIEGELK